jgi:hypothetical protein
VELHESVAMVEACVITLLDKVAQILVGVGQRCLDDVEAETRYASLDSGQAPLASSASLAGVR